MEAVFLIWGLSFFGMLGLFAYQGYLYLKLGEWVTFSATDVCAQYLHSEWCAWPHDWLGLHRLLSQVNAGALVWIAASLVLLAAIETEKKK